MWYDLPKGFSLVRKFSTHMKANNIFFTSSILWSTCLQLFWCEKAIVYSSFGMKILLFELKKRPSDQIVFPFSGKLIGVHHEVARAVVRAPSAKKFTSSKLAFYHFLNMIGAHVWFPRAPAHAPSWCANRYYTRRCLYYLFAILARIEAFKMLILKHQAGS